MAIDPRQLANLLAVANHGSLNRAAAARGLSQPALSASIRLLERRLGVSVLDRTSSGSRLNQYGEILVRRGQTIEALLLQAGEEVRLRKLGIEGPLRVGATPSLMLKFVPDIIVRLLQANPDAAVSLSEGLDDQLLSELRAGHLDLLFGPIADVTPTGGDILEEPLFKDAFSIGVRQSHPLSRRRSLSLVELRDAAWVLPGPDNSLRRHIEGLCTAANLPWPAKCVTTTSLAVIESILNNTDRIALITTLLQHAWGVRSIPLQGAGVRTIGIKRRRAGQLTPLAEQMRQIALGLPAVTGRGRSIAARHQRKPVVRSAPRERL
jgi:LysR family transcriptional regulator, regulator for genes of the gallate degradation pathway